MDSNIILRIEHGKLSDNSKNVSFITLVHRTSATPSVRKYSLMQFFRCLFSNFISFFRNIYNHGYIEIGGTNGEWVEGYIFKDGQFVKVEKESDLPHVHCFYIQKNV